MLPDYLINMLYDKHDVPFIIFVLGIILFVLYTNYTYTSETTEYVKEIKDYNLSILIRQARIEDKQEQIMHRIDSIRFLYLRN
jgi:hypothetical protein